MAVGALVLGIISLLCWFVSSLFIPGIIGIILGIVGIVLAVLAKKKQPSGMATAGLVLCIIGLILNGIGVIACAACFGASGCAALSSL